MGPIPVFPIRRSPAAALLPLPFFRLPNENRMKECRLSTASVTTRISFGIRADTVKRKRAVAQEKRRKSKRFVSACFTAWHPLLVFQVLGSPEHFAQSDEMSH